MNRYTYRFIWKDKATKKFHRKFIEAPSQDKAIEEFEEEFGVSVKEDSVKVFRVYN